jgi:hypothetical protein
VHFDGDSQAASSLLVEADEVPQEKHLGISFTHHQQSSKDPALR